MERLRRGYMTIWDLELTMTLLVVGAQPWPTVLMEQGKIFLCSVTILIYALAAHYHVLILSWEFSCSGFSLAGPVKMESHTLLNGMKVKEL